MCFRRPTYNVALCPSSYLLPNENCPTTITEKFYVRPRSGEPVPPTATCDVHGSYEMTVCADSGGMPTFWCERTKTIVLPPGPPPCSCPSHAAPPPRAATPLTVFVPELLVAEGNVRAFMRSFRMAGGWRVRFFLLQSWAAVRLVPWLQAFYLGAPVRIVRPDDGIDSPVTDMNQPNPAFWNRLAEILAILRECDLEADVALGDNCSYNTRPQKVAYPWTSSLQTMSAAETWQYLVPPEATAICVPSSGGLYGPVKYPLFRAWVKDVVDAMTASGVPFRAEVQNEFSRLGWAPSAPEPWDWYSMKVDALQTNGVHPGRLLHSGDLEITLAHPGVYSMHGIAQAGYFPFPDSASRLMLSGDGSYGGPYAGRSLTDVDVDGRRGVSVEDAEAIARMIDRDGIVGGYEWMPRRLWRFKNNLANVDDIPMDVPRAMTAVLS